MYFYDKQQHRYYIASATCPTAIMKREGKYFVLSSLVHMMHFNELQQIDSPAELTRWIGKSKPQDRDFSRNSESDLSHGKNLFTYRDFNLLLLSVFNLGQQPIYLVQWQGTTFLVTWLDDTFRIVDPLFHRDLYTNNPVTTTYGQDIILMNLNSDGEEETSCLLITGKQATKINWSVEAVSKQYSTAEVILESDDEFPVVDSVEVQEVD